MPRSTNPFRVPCHALAVFLASRIPPPNVPTPTTTTTLQVEAERALLHSQQQVSEGFSGTGSIDTDSRSGYDGEDRMRKSGRVKKVGLHGGASRK